MKDDTPGDDRAELHSNVRLSAPLSETDHFCTSKSLAHKAGSLGTYWTGPNGVAAIEFDVLVEVAPAAVVSGRGKAIP